MTAEKKANRTYETFLSFFQQAMFPNPYGLAKKCSVIHYNLQLNPTNSKEITEIIDEVGKIKVPDYLYDCDNCSEFPCIELNVGYKKIEFDKCDKIKRIKK